METAKMLKWRRERPHTGVKFLAGEFQLWRPVGVERQGNALFNLPRLGSLWSREGEGSSSSSLPPGPRRDQAGRKAPVPSPDWGHPSLEKVGGRGALLLLLS